MLDMAFGLTDTYVSLFWVCISTMKDEVQNGLTDPLRSLCYSRMITSMIHDIILHLLGSISVPDYISLDPNHLK